MCLPREDGGASCCPLYKGKCSPKPKASCKESAELRDGQVFRATSSLSSCGELQMAALDGEKDIDGSSSLTTHAPRIGVLLQRAAELGSQKDVARGPKSGISSEKVARAEDVVTSRGSSGKPPLRDNSHTLSPQTQAHKAIAAKVNSYLLTSPVKRLSRLCLVELLISFCLSIQALSASSRSSTRTCSC